MVKIDFHGDDYGISPNNCNRMLELVKDGHLDSFSVIANMSCYDECMDILKAKWDSLPIKPLISVHINLIGGLSVSGENRQYASWGAIFKESLMPGEKRKQAKLSIKKEIKAQIERVYSDTKDLDGVTGIRLDSHVHTHMIPMVFDAMMEAVKELGLEDKLEFVRLSKEPLMMFFTTAGVKGTFPIVNVIKNIVLRVLSVRADRILKKAGITHGLLWGLIMSGKMDKDRMNILLPKMREYAKKRNAYMEILGHPGIVLESEMLPEYGPDDTEAFISENRNIEYEAMKACNVR